MGLPLDDRAKGTSPFMGMLMGGLPGMAISAGSDLLNTAMGMALSGWQDRRQLRQQQKLQELQMQGNKEMMNYQNDLTFDLWQKTGPQGQVNQLKEAGLNPALMYGMGGGTGGVTVSPSGSVDGGGTSQQPMALMMSNLANTAAEINLKNAQARNLDANTTKTAGVDTDEALSRKENNILSGIILKYQGKEAQEYFENVAQPNRGIQAKTYQDELEARQGLAGTIYELWLDGKLKEKALSEIEGLALQNTKTAEDINRIKAETDLLGSKLRTQDLENMLTEMEYQLQKTTGIDRNSPVWFKMLGRLFTQIFGDKVK